MTYDPTDLLRDLPPPAPAICPSCGWTGDERTCPDCGRPAEPNLDQGEPR